MRPRKVLVVEDDDDLRRLYRSWLTLADFSVREARGGFEALRLMDHDPPDIVVLDLMMPGVDGYAVRLELEAHAHTRSIPIVVVTAAPPADPGVLNVRCVLVKPVLAIDLVAAVKRCLASGSAAGV